MENFSSFFIHRITCIQDVELFFIHIHTHDLILFFIHRMTYTRLKIIFHLLVEYTHMTKFFFSFTRRTYAQFYLLLLFMDKLIKVFTSFITKTKLKECKDFYCDIMHWVFFAYLIFLYICLSLSIFIFSYCASYM